MLFYKQSKQNYLPKSAIQATYNERSAQIWLSLVQSVVLSLKALLPLHVVGKDIHRNLFGIS